MAMKRMAPCVIQSVKNSITESVRYAGPSKALQPLKIIRINYELKLLF